MKDLMDALEFALNKIEMPGAQMMDFGCTAAQYHYGLDQLWGALRLTGVQDKDVFTLCAERIRDLEEEVRQLKMKVGVLEMKEATRGL